MTYLLDTNVVSALRVRGRNPAVEAWATSVPLESQFISVFSVAEIEAGVVKKERVDRAQGEVLRRWFESQVLPAFADRVLPYDLAAARVFASYRVPEHAPADDAVIAAVADANALVVATRNVAHFAPLGVAVVNPFDQAAPSSSVAALEAADDEVDRRAAASARAEMCEAEAAPIP